MSQEKAGYLTFDLCRDSPFSFFCRACSRCCQGKVILVGPHEILGMSRALGISTSELLSRYTEMGGTALRTAEDGRCVFVGPEGCRVHARRPLVCRLYPLGRQTDLEGRESFAMYASQPGCEAEIGRYGTVAEFLESQGVEPYFVWSRRYSEIYRRMIVLLGRAETEPEKGPKDEPALAPYLSPWQDIDASLAEYCAAMGLTPPADIDAAIDLHIRAMEEWLEALEGKP